SACVALPISIPAAPRTSRWWSVLACRSPCSFGRLRGASAFVDRHNIRGGLATIEGCGDSGRNLVRGGDGCSIGPANIVASRHAPARVAEQFSDRCVAIAFIRGNAAECAAQIVGSCVLQSGIIENRGDRFL